MGKSPAKWIKTVLFGKKTPKTNLSKNATERKVSSDGKGPTDALTVDSLAATDVPAQITHESGENTVLERGTSANLPVDAAQLHGEQGSDEATGQSNLVNNADIVQLEEAATKAQAAFRGYLARRAFKALKGIIRLQALIRGHLVRRQAVSTLRCMHGIVKFQAVVRGGQVRLSDAGREVIRNLKSGESTESKQMDMVAFVKSGKLSRNSFVNKLVASFPTVMPLSLQYDVADPNSVWSWLERWSSSRFWEPVTRPKKHINSKRQRRPINNVQTSERESGKVKRASQRAPASNGDSSSLRSSTEHEKPKRSQRKVPAQAEPVHDQPQSELERVKRNLKKVSTMIEEASEKAEAVAEKPSLKRAANSDVPGQVIDTTPSQIIGEPVTISDQPEVEPTPKPLETDEAVNTLVGEDLPAVETLSLENGDKVLNGDKLTEELNPKEDQTKENQKTRRRKSLPVKQDYSENVSQNTPTRPSYMQATQSAKAKLRAQSSPKFGEDEGENGFVRRHSLPSSTNGKPSLLSPRVQKPLVHSNGKGGSKSDKSLLSRDGNDKGGLHPGWRR